MVGVSYIDITKEREYFAKKFRCEVLTSCMDNKTAIQGFGANDLGKNLEQYLKCEAWAIDQEGETRVYIVKDENDQIALFFSIKCGLLYEPYEYERLEPTEQEFINSFKVLFGN